MRKKQSILSKIRNATRCTVSLLEVLTVLARAISKRKKESGYRWERKKSFLQMTRASI